ncbi:DNA translocase FtsK [Thalassotalea profundi]|uniref:DNA translocase FtsK n=2 Tax=Thalassotalea profundi TaxID=2036687 RepID=A0ABQ3II48_9GAMM|nr:DNA translocase FtsK [Thalassotalea profundi]GHE82595.1 DNA translocase FtsK [Thalassotalea profundi]
MSDIPSPIKLNGVQRLLEAGLLVSCVLAMYIMLALFSFDAADPGWSQTGYQTPVRNLGGAVGAYISDMLLNIFGVVAYTLPFVIAMIGWLLFQKYYKLVQLDYLTLGLKFIGFIMFYMGITSISSMNFDDIFYFSAGGILGDVLSNAVVPYFSFVGSTLLFLTFVLSGFVLVTGISLLKLIDCLGEKTINLALKTAEFPEWIKAKFDSRPSSNSNIDEHQGKQSKINKELLSTSPLAGKVADVDQQDVHQAFSSLSPQQDSNIISTSKNDSPFQKDDDIEPFINIDDLMGEPLAINVQEHVSDDEINAAFEHVEKIDVVQAPSKKPAVKLETNEEFVMPSIDLLDRPDKAEHPIDEEQLSQVSRLVEAKLAEFGVQADVVGVYPGPVITRFELDLAPGIKVSKITGLSKDLARSLSAKAVRVVEVIPGKSVIGLELPNKHREIVYLKDVLASEKFEQASSSLTMAIGQDIAGEPVVVDLAKMPHLLVAGTTGSGKSVAINTMILSLLYKSTPEDVRMIMIDPKMLELSVYEGIPHLLSEVVTDMKEASNALRWCVGEMERRYKVMSALGVRNLKGYNVKIANAIADGEPLIDPLWQPSSGLDQTPPLLEKLPSIVVVVDEFADMMMIVGKKVEELIARIAQKARAAGIHLILATQRPSVDVITGLIKANIPTRMALQVSSRIDSRTILDQQGAEQLLGYGDMFYLPPGSGLPTRVHGAFVDDHEVHAVVKDWKSRGEPNYVEEILSGENDQDILLPGETAEGEDSDLDTIYDEALQFVTETRRVSISSIQRKFRIGYNRAARIVEQMEMQGVVTTPGNNGAREVLAPPPIKE